MGSQASLAVPDMQVAPAGATWAPGPDLDSATADVRAWLDRVEATLSPYREDSDLCRWRRGDVALHDCSPLLAEVVDAVDELTTITEGAFHAYDRRGRFDPTGYVKGWAVDRAVGILADAGVGDACFGIGGDLQLIGRAGADRQWRVALTDPADEHRVVAIVEAPRSGSRFAMATSGGAQRGDHIWAGRGGAAPSALRTTGAPGQPALAAVTVVGPDLRLADAFATAVWAHAQAHPLHVAWSWLAGTGYEALAVGRGGWVRWTPAMAQHLVRAAA